jgi:aspartyl-tRNA(Asn)/glutamyl-tRNA(Gln) amidotransferase subunit A
MTAIHNLTAQALSSAYRAKQLSPVEAAGAALARIAAWETKINAMYVVDEAGARAQAAASEARWRVGVPLSALDGVPITIKDNIPVKGFATPVGTAAGDMTSAAADAPPSARVREAGCIIIGKTKMPDYGMLVSGVSSLHGITRNPWNRSRNAGGSSSGAGASLVAGYTPLALGTDIGGSVRLPAAYNGVFALKPSLGRVPIYPPYLGRVVGPMTRTVADAALLMTALTKPDARDYMVLPYQEIDWSSLLQGDAQSDLKGKKLGLLLDIGIGLALQPAVRAAITEARLLAELQLLPPERQEKVLPFIVTWCRRAEKLSAADAARNLALVMLMREKAVAATEPYDFLISPTSPITAYAAEEATPGDDPTRPFEHIGFTAPFNMSEQPAASICAGYDADGMPIGLQIIGHRFDDVGVLRTARAYEALRPPQRAWPEG